MKIENGEFIPVDNKENILKEKFVSKLGIALKETVETEYWLNLLRDSHFLTEAQADSLLSDCLEIKAILITSIKTTKAATAR